MYASRPNPNPNGYSIKGDIQPRMDISVRVVRTNGKADTVTVRCRIDTLDELAYYRNGGILHTVLRHLARG